MYELLGEREDVPWGSIELWQVDERVSPAGDPDRNLTHLLASLSDVSDVRIHPMPVDREDLDAAADAYARGLPAAFDLIHLGLGSDGHTASLAPGDPALDVDDRDVAVTGPYRGRRRMTLTFPALARAREILWLVTGADKAAALRRLLAHDRSIPAGRVDAPMQIVIADREAVPAR
jgi:6-phosphogluconolactonase/glucosamine-6-phosphate isomerase/deaminase